MAKKKRVALDSTVGRLAKGGRISAKALKRFKLKAPKLPKLKIKSAIRGSDIPPGAPRGGVGRGMAGR